MNLRKTAIALSIVSLIITASCVFAAPAAKNTVYYVSPYGADTSDGMAAKPASDSASGPFATLEKAIDTVINDKAADKADRNYTVRLHRGIYYLDKPITVPGKFASLTIEPIKGHKVTLSGMKPVINWTKHTDTIYKADISGLKLDLSKPRHLYEMYHPNPRMHLARRPNFDPANPLHGGFAYIPEIKDPDNHQVMAFDPAQLDTSDLTDAKHLQLHMYPGHNYGSKTYVVEKIDNEENLIHFGEKIHSHFTVNDRFHLQNALALIDAPGEYYIDPDTAILYYYPISKVPGLAAVSAIENIVLLRNCRNIHFKNLTLEGSRETAVKLMAGSNCSLNNCLIRYTGSIGVDMHSGSSHNRILNCEITNTGAGGIRIIGKVLENHLTTDNVISGNHIHHNGLLNTMEQGGMYIIAADKTRITNNHVHDTYRWGISLNASSNTLVEYNHVHDTNLTTEDTAPIYTVASWGGWDIHMDPDNNEHLRGNIIRYNHVHDPGGYGRIGSWFDMKGHTIGEYTTPYFSWGIYLDLPSSGTHVYGNLVEGGFMGTVIIGGGRDNVIENNICIDGHYAQAYICQWSERYPMGNNRFINNIFTWTNPNARFFHHTGQYGQLCSPEKAIFRGNLIQPPTDDIKVRYIHDQAMVSMEKWLEMSEVGGDFLIADPMFVNLEKGDYRLKAASPAYRTGFKPLPEKVYQMCECNR